MEDWAEIRRLHKAEGVPIKEIARRLGVARNTVRATLASDRPPKYERAPRGSVADAFEPQMRALLVQWPRMPVPVDRARILGAVGGAQERSRPDPGHPVGTRRPRSGAIGRPPGRLADDARRGHGSAAAGQVRSTPRCRRRSCGHRRRPYLLHGP